jgi:hypothetical protein
MNWHEIISRGTPVKTKDSAGYGEGEYENSLLVIMEKLVSQEYLIPKKNVDSYDGKECLLISALTK